MNRQELQEVLRRERIKDSCYSLEEKSFDPDEALCLRQIEGAWVVFYSERGLQTGKTAFNSESAACEYMLDALCSDPTTRVGWSSGFRMPSGA